MDILFFKVFRNEYLKYYIFKFIHSEYGIHYKNYNSTSSIKKMIDSDKYEMILDKLKTKSFISINYLSILQLFKTNTKHHQKSTINEILKLLLEQYGEIINSLPILENSIKNNNFEIFEFFLTQLINKNKILNIQGNINYQLYSLLDLSLKYYIQNHNLKFTTLILKSLNIERSNNNFMNEQNGNNEKELIEIILNKNKKEIGFISNMVVFNVLKSLEFNEDIINLLEKKLNIDVCWILNEYYNKVLDGNIIISSISNKRLLNQIIDIHLKDSCGSKRIILKNYYVNNLEHSKIYLLKKLNSNINNELYESINNFKKHFKENTISTIEDLMELVYELLIDPKLQFSKDVFSSSCKEAVLSFYNYLEYFFIYYCLKNNKFKILGILKEKVNFNNSLIFTFSIFKLSIELLELCFINSTNNELVEFNEKGIYNNLIEIEKNDIKKNEFYNHFMEYSKYFTNSHWLKLFKVVLVFHPEPVFYNLYYSSIEFKEKYYYFLNNQFDDIFSYHFKDLPLLRYRNLLKKDSFIFACNSLKMINTNTEYYISQFNKLLSNDGFIKDLEYPNLIKQLLSNYKDFRIYQFIKYLLYNSQFLNIDITIQIYKSINNDLYYSSFLNYIFEDYFLSLSNIFIKHLIKSILNKDLVDLIKIISIINSNILINIKDIKEIFYNSSNHIKETFKYLIKNNYLNSFTPSILINEFDEYLNLKLIENLDKNNKIIETKSKSLNNYIIEKNDLYNYLIYGYYREAYYILKKYKLSKLLIINNKDYITINMPSEKIIKSFIDNSISLEWFIRFYNPLIKNILIDHKIIKDYCYERLDIFEFLWINFLVNDKFKSNFIFDLFSSNTIKYQQLTEYILKEKKLYIKENIKFEINQIKIIHTNSLIYGTPTINKIIREIYMENIDLLKIDFLLLKELIHVKSSNQLYSYGRYDIIEYLYFNNLIPNLKLIIGEDNLKNFKVIEFYNEIDNDELIYHKDSIVLSKSMFILIYSIIRNQDSNNNNQLVLSSSDDIEFIDELKKNKENNNKDINISTRNNEGCGNINNKDQKYNNWFYNFYNFYIKFK